MLISSRFHRWRITLQSFFRSTRIEFSRRFTSRTELRKCLGTRLVPRWKIHFSPPFPSVLLVRYFFNVPIHPLVQLFFSLFFSFTVSILLLTSPRSHPNAGIAKTSKGSEIYLVVLRIYSTVLALLRPRATIVSVS